MGRHLGQRDSNEDDGRMGTNVMSPQLQIESVADAKRQWMLFVSESNLSTKTDLKNGGFCSCEQFAEPLLEGSSLSTARS